MGHCVNYPNGFEVHRKKVDWKLKEKQARTFAYDMEDVQKGTVKVLKKTVSELLETRKDRDELRALGWNLLALLERECLQNHEACPETDCDLKPAIAKAKRVLGEKP